MVLWCMEIPAQVQGAHTSMQTLFTLAGLDVKIGLLFVYCNCISWMKDAEHFDCFRKLMKGLYLLHAKHSDCLRKLMKDFIPPARGGTQSNATSFVMVIGERQVSNILVNFTYCFTRVGLNTRTKHKEWHQCRQTSFALDAWLRRVWTTLFVCAFIGVVYVSKTTHPSH